MGEDEGKATKEGKLFQRMLKEAPDEEVTMAELNPSQKAWFEDRRYLYPKGKGTKKNPTERMTLPTRAQMATKKCFAGAVLPYKNGYMVLKKAINKNKVVLAPKTLLDPWTEHRRCTRCLLSLQRYHK